MTLQEKNTKICKFNKAAYEKEHLNDEGESEKDLQNRICFDGLIYLKVLRNRLLKMK